MRPASPPLIEQRKARLVDSTDGRVLAVYGAARRAEGAGSIPFAPNPFAFLLRVRREAAAAPAKRKASGASLSRVGKGLQPRFGSTNQRGRREAASAWRVKAERSEAFTRQQGLQAVVTSATFLREKGQEGEKEEGKEYGME